MEAKISMVSPDYILRLHTDFKTEGALSDLTLLKKAREEAFKFLEGDPKLQSPEGMCIKEVLKARWEGRLELAEVG